MKPFIDELKGWIADEQQVQAIAHRCAVNMMECGDDKRAIRWQHRAAYAHQLAATYRDQLNSLEKRT